MYPSTPIKGVSSGFMFCFVCCCWFSLGFLFCFVDLLFCFVFVVDSNEHRDLQKGQHAENKKAGNVQL